MRQYQLLIAFALGCIISTTSLNSGGNVDCVLAPMEVKGRVLLRLRGGDIEFNIDDNGRRSTKRKLRSEKYSKSEKRQHKRERRKDRSALTASKNIEAKEEARLLALKQAASDNPSMDRAEKVIYETVKGSKMKSRRQTGDDAGLGWEEQQAIAERIGDGVPDWRRLQAAVQQRAASSAADERGAGSGGGSDDDLPSHGDADGTVGVSAVRRTPAARRDRAVATAARSRVLPPQRDGAASLNPGGSTFSYGRGAAGACGGADQLRYCRWRAGEGRAAARRRGVHA
jgi:hypothetical protein